MIAPPTFPVLDVLTRSGAARDGFVAAIDDTVDTDAGLVSDVLRVAGRVGETLATRRALVELCAVVRALDSCLAGDIELAELARGVAVHAARTDGFAHFDEARVLLRTLDELLARAAAPDANERALRSQVAWLDGELRSWLLEQMTGSPTGTLPTPTASAAPMPPTLVSDLARVRASNELTDDLLANARFHDVRGLAAAAWVRGWSAVPRAGERLGDDPDEAARLLAALLDIGTHELLHVDLAPRARWHLHGDQLHVADGLRTVAAHTVADDTLAALTVDRPAHGLFTDDAGSFALLEADDHHVVAGPRPFVEAVCGCTVGEALAAFREHVEERAGDDEPPPELLLVAQRYGRLRRRGRGTS